MSRFVSSYRALDVYRNAIDAAMEVFKLSAEFPSAERYSMTDQIRRSSRSVCANLAEAWRKRRYRAAFISKLSDVESEAAETEVWLELAMKCGYVTPETCDELSDRYDKITAQVVKMMRDSDRWLVKSV